MWDQLINECLIYTVSLRLIGDFLTSLLSAAQTRFLSLQGWQADPALHSSTG